MGDFAVAVRRYITMRKLSLRDTARAAGYSGHTLLSKVLNGHKPVTPYLAAALDDALDVAGYRGADPAPVPHPLAIDAASVQ